jgi:hypothetical protein
VVLTDGLANSGLIDPAAPFEVLIQSQAPYRLATPQWTSQIRARLTTSCAPPPAVFRGDQVLTPETSQDAIR